MNEEKITALEKKIQKEHGNIAGMVVLKDGRTVYENYFNGCGADDTIHVFSVTKSIVSILAGIAIDRGYIGGVDQKAYHDGPVQIQIGAVHQIFFQRGLGDGGP